MGGQNWPPFFASEWFEVEFCGVCSCLALFR